MADEAFTRQVDATPRENDLLEVVLGYRHILHRVTRAAERRSEGQEGADERMVLALLGVMSLEAQLGRWLRTTGAADVESPAPSAELHDSLLR